MKKRIILENISESSKLFTISQVQTEFEANLKERGLRPVTLRFYNNIMEAFYKFKDYKEPVSNITESTISDYINYCRNIRNNSQNTVSTNIRGLRTVLYFAMKKGYMDSFKIHVPTPDLTPKTTYSIKEVQRLLNKPNLQHCGFSEYIAYIAVNIFVFTGCRVSTAINIKIADIDLDNNLIYYRHTKNKKPHAVPLPAELRKVLIKHFKLLENQNIKTEYILISAYGEKLNYGKIYRYIHRYNLKRGVSSTSLHAFRRFYIKSLVLQGVPIPKIQFLVQHKTPELITLYTKLYSSDLVDDVQKFTDSIVVKKPQKIRIKK
ncbi:tyrosine-type recombinase/integrase [Clostridium tyrobutyricum]|uniref:tyrosine-type recombinase/integrase n=1 Tax=Clostridium tyrobutyricum TaxID=1519 RepID=UPI0010AAB353|nr:site-specific integrase [Clostridium tyrobutyricum]QCH27183.1 site-specific tyrosine recombinase XerD [Clostridium tyrobutyricum]